MWHSGAKPSVTSAVVQICSIWRARLLDQAG
jgi:hypothetical protein